MTEPFVQRLEADDQLTQVWQRLANLEEVVEKGMKDVERSAQRTESAVREAGEKGASSWGRLSVSVVSVNQALELGARVARAALAPLQAYAREETSITQLSRALENHGIAWSQVKTQVDSFTQARQEMTRFGDTATREVLNQFATTTRGLDLTIEELIEGATLVQDASELTGRSAVEVARQVARAYAGNTEALGELLPAQRQYFQELAQTAPQSEVARIAVQELQETYGGAAESISDSERALVNVENAWGDFLESLGSLAVSITPAIQALADAIGAVSNAVKAGGEFFSDAFDAIFDAGAVEQINDAVTAMDATEQAIWALRDAGLGTSPAVEVLEGRLHALRMEAQDTAGRMGLAGRASLANGIEEAADAARRATPIFQQMMAELEVDTNTRRVIDLLSNMAFADSIGDDLEREAEERRRIQDQILQAEQEYRDFLFAKATDARNRELEAMRDHNERVKEDERRIAEDERRIAQERIDDIIAQNSAQLEARARANEAEEASRQATIDNVDTTLDALSSLAKGVAAIQIPIEIAKSVADFASAATAFAALNIPQGLAFTAAGVEHIRAARQWAKAGGGGGGGASASRGGGRGGRSPAPTQGDPRGTARPTVIERNDAGFGGTTFVMEVDGRTLGRVVTRSQRRYFEFNNGDALPLGVR